MFKVIFSTTYNNLIRSTTPMRSRTAISTSSEKLDLDEKRASAGDALPSILSTGSVADATPPQKRRPDPITDDHDPQQAPPASFPGDRPRS